VKDNVLLYVKSRKVSNIEYAQVPALLGKAGYEALPMSARTAYNYRPEDQEAINFLKEAGIAYKLLDLSDCTFVTRLKAKVSGINEKTTLILNDRKIVGVENIKKVLEEMKPKKPSK